MASEALFDNWMVAVAEAAGVAGAKDLASASPDQVIRAWKLVGTTAGLTAPELVDRIATEADVPVARLSQGDPQAAHVVPAALAHKWQVMPLRCTDRDLAVATANPGSEEAKRELITVTGRAVHFEMAAPEDLRAAINGWYGEPDDAAPVASLPTDLVKPSGPHVLVIDDEATARALFRSILEGRGYRVTLANDGHEALDLLSTEHDFDLVTLDYWMPRMNGLRVLQVLRKKRFAKDLPVIMVTAAEDRRIVMSLFEAGADDFVRKPLDAPLFLLRVNAVLRRRQIA